MADIWANTCLGERGSLMVRSDKNPFVSDHMRAAEKYLADEMPDQRRQRANGVTGKKHRTLRTNWGTPSTHRLWPGGGSHMRRATIARPGGPLSGPPSFAVAVGRHPTHHDQSDVPKHSPAFVAPLGHPQHAPAFGGGATVSATGLGRVAQGSDICAAIFCGRRRPGQSASWPINSAKTFICVCGPFGAPRTRIRLDGCQYCALYAPALSLFEGPSDDGCVQCGGHLLARDVRRIAVGHPPRRHRRPRPAHRIVCCSSCHLRDASPCCALRSRISETLFEFTVAGAACFWAPDSVGAMGDEGPPRKRRFHPPVVASHLGDRAPPPGLAERLASLPSGGLGNPATVCGAGTASRPVHPTWSARVRTNCGRRAALRDTTWAALTVSNDAPSRRPRSE